MAYATTEFIIMTNLIPYINFFCIICYIFIIMRWFKPIPTHITYDNIKISNAHARWNNMVVPYARWDNIKRIPCTFFASTPLLTHYLPYSYIIYICFIVSLKMYFFASTLFQVCLGIIIYVINMIWEIFIDLLQPFMCAKSYYTCIPLLYHESRIREQTQFLNLQMKQYAHMIFISQ